jgi:multidrug efflux pump
VSLSDPFIRRPVATSLLTLALALAGGIAYFMLPVSPLPQVEFPTIQVSAALPGASPETMASAVATPLERQFRRIAGITEMTSTSNLGSTAIVMQFDLNRNIDAAARACRRRSTRRPASCRRTSRRGRTGGRSTPPTRR